ncbi:MAG TPA: neutral zinc metallopeptidase [Caldisericia bacterium]|nr:neutral zinc metallopeptidase [Caldisericia bacterium]
MRWKDRRRSDNIEDRRGKGIGGFAAVGGTLGIILILIYTLLGGGNISDVLNNFINNENNTTTYEETAEEKELSEFVSVVLADTEDIWTEVLKDYGYQYDLPKLVLFTDTVYSGCGIASSQSGPFYCPGDETVYLDLSFFEELQNRFGVTGDFAIAYVIAHEVGHHVQNLLGILDQIQEIQRQVTQEEFNEYSVRVELQADYLAGVWARHVEELGYLEEGDLEEALNAASAVGDDRIQKQTQGYVVPDSFTHGTSEQRNRWFYKGFQTGNLDNWDTFNIDEL